MMPYCITFNIRSITGDLCSTGQSLKRYYRSFLWFTPGVLSLSCCCGSYLGHVALSFLFFAMVLAFSLSCLSQFLSFVERLLQNMSLSSLFVMSFILLRSFYTPLQWSRCVCDSSALVSQCLHYMSYYISIRMVCFSEFFLSFCFGIGTRHKCHLLFFLLSGPAPSTQN